MQDDEKMGRSEKEKFMADQTTRQTKMMNCKQTKEKLSEYMDGLLDGQVNRQIKQHLRSCDDCRAEHASLKTLLDDLASLELVTPPTDFLDQLHRRMDSKFMRIIRKLFLPWHIKLPLELATAMVLVLAVYFGTSHVGFKKEYHVSEKPKTLKLAQAPPVEGMKTIQQPHAPAGKVSGSVDLSGDTIKKEPHTAGATTEEAATEDAQPPGREEKATDSGTADDIHLLAKADQQPEKQRSKKSDLSEVPEALMEYRGSLRDAVKPTPTPAEPSQGPVFRPGAAPEDKSEQKMPPEVITVAKAPAKEAVETKQETSAQNGFLSIAKTAGMTPPQKEPETIELALLLKPEQNGREKLWPERPGGELTVSMGSRPSESVDRQQISRFKRALSKLKDLVGSAKGKVVAVEYEKETKRPQSVDVEIPSENYKTFYDGLKMLGNFESPLESIEDTHQRSIPVRILLKSKK